MAALAQTELESKRERITDSVAKRRAAGKDLGGRRRTVTDSQIRNALRLIESGGGHTGRPGPRDVAGDPVPADPGVADGQRLSVMVCRRVPHSLSDVRGPCCGRSRTVRHNLLAGASTTVTSVPQMCLVLSCEMVRAPGIFQRSYSVASSSVRSFHGP